MIWRIIGFTALGTPLLGLLALMAWAMVQSGGNPGGLGINSVFGQVNIKEGPAPPFSLTLLTGGKLDMDDLRGKVVMVDFWSSWCPPCVQEASILASTYLEYADRRVEFVGVAIWDEEMEVARFVERFGSTYPNGLDALGEVAIGYGVRGIPEKFFIDGQGRMVRKFVGPASAETLRAIIDELLSMEG